MKHVHLPFPPLQEPWLFLIRCVHSLIVGGLTFLWDPLSTGFNHTWSLWNISWAEPTPGLMVWMVVPLRVVEGSSQFLSRNVSRPHVHLFSSLPFLFSGVALILYLLFYYNYLLVHKVFHAFIVSDGCKISYFLYWERKSLFLCTWHDIWDVLKPPLSSLLTLYSCIFLNTLLF